MEWVQIMEPELAVAVKTFINQDGSVDGELRMDNLPDEWRTRRGLPFMVESLTNMLRVFKPFDEKPAFGGKYWISIGVRFGPSNETEAGELADVYKRFRGLFQVGTYYGPAWITSRILQSVAIGMKTMIEGLEDRRGLPPASILIRFVWTPDGVRPGRESGEK